MSNLNQVLDEVHIYSDSDVIQRKITNKELDMPTKPFVFNKKYNYTKVIEKNLMCDNCGNYYLVYTNYT